MNYTFDTATGNGTTTAFSFGFVGPDEGYIDLRRDLRVFVNNVPVAFTTSFADPNKVFINPAPAMGASILIRRIMPRTAPFSDFKGQNAFTPTQLNNTALQQLYLTQELLDGFYDADFYLKQDLNMGGHKIINMGNGTSPNDAVNFGQLDAVDQKHTTWNSNQDAEITAIKEGLVSNVSSRTIPWLHIGAGGETVISPPFQFISAWVWRQGIMQYQLNGAYEVVGNTIKLAEPLSVGEEVLIALGSAAAAPDDYVTYQDVLGMIGSLAQRKYAKSALESGAVADKVTDCTTIIQSMIDSMTEGYINIEYGVRWDERLINKKYNVHIIDMSGLNPVSNQWGGQYKFIMHTDNPSAKNAHEVVVKGWHHPAFVVDNTGEGVAQRASIVFRYNNTTQWRVGSGISDLDSNFLIASGTSLAGRYYIDRDNDWHSWNTGIVSGVHYHFANRNNQGNLVTRWSARGDFGNVHSFFNKTNTPAESIENQRVFYKSDGTIEYSQNASRTFTIDVDGSIYGLLESVLPRTTSFNLTRLNSNRLITNEGSVGQITLTLPVATVGLKFRFLNTAGVRMVVRPNQNGVDLIRGAGVGVATEATTAGSSMELVCAVNGTWDYVGKLGFSTLP